MNCNGCGCIANFDDETEFCGRLIRSSNDKSTTLMGCDKTCPPCKNCKYPPEDYRNKTENVPTRKKNNNKSRKKNNDNNSLTKQALLNMLKRQKELNALEGIGKGPLANSDENNNASAQFSEDLNLSNHVNKKPRATRRNANNYNQNNNFENNNTENTKEDYNCTKYDQKDCKSNYGCEWDNENVVCKSLDVIFYTQSGENGVSFKLPVGNYDKSDIENFEFKPEFMAVPLGLRVKIWKKSGYVGPNLGFLGNNNASISNVKKNLYPIDELGSIQICNMETCVKPSAYEDMQLISLIDGNNIDFVEDNVKDLGTYKESLREKIHRKLLDVRFTHKDCLEQVALFLNKKEIDISEDLTNINNSFMLQKIHYELDNLPPCDKLIETVANTKNQFETRLSPIESLLENIPYPSRSFNTTENLQLNTNNVKNNLNNVKNNLSNVMNNVNNLSHVKNNINNLQNNVNTLLEEEGNINFIIFIFVFLLIVLLISALVYIYYTPKFMSSKN
jgi:hypothetical protein